MTKSMAGALVAGLFNVKVSGKGLIAMVQPYEGRAAARSSRG